MPESHARPAVPENPKRITVLLPLPLPGPYDYRLPEGMALEAGMFVRVPLGGRDIVGVVWNGAPGAVAEGRLKPVIECLDAPPLPAATRQFVDWVARYTLAAPGAVLRMAMSVPAALRPLRETVAYTLSVPMPPEIRPTPARRRVLDLLASSPPLGVMDIAREAAVGPAVVRSLAAAGVLEAVAQRNEPAVPEPDWRRPGVELSPEQSAAADRLRAAVAAAAFSVSVLDGVPGSGKTEVYFEAVAEALARGRQVLVMLPEIALSAQWLVRFRHRFGADPLEWHSDLGQASRRATWRAVADGRARVVVGARSALFLPFPDLGLIVVDEEHDSSYKQEDGVLYNARDMAVVRARIGGIPVVPASATPSLETVENIRAGRYECVTVTERHARVAAPDVTLIDLRKQNLPATRWISAPLRNALAATLAAGEQSLLFLNRRGYAPLTLCRKCGHRLQCPRCSAWLVEHRLAGDAARLQCHYCGYAMREPAACPQCKAERPFAACGPGVERLAEEVAEAFPAARVAIAASDTLTGPRAAEDLVRRIEQREIDIIVGTQIVAKGYHFPMLTLVGVVDGDLGLAGGDLRASERTFQLLYQVAGRAGRGSRPGRVLLQSVMPEHPVMAAIAAGERDRFLEAEAASRRETGAPPFGRWTALIVSSADESAADEAARLLARFAPHGDGVAVLGPAPAPLALLRGQHRRRLLLKARADLRVQPLVSAWLARVKLPARVQVRVDVDPYSFL